MAHHFREDDIDEFRECFYLFAREGTINKLEELTTIMRSLGMSPTITELKKYFSDNNGKLNFPDLLKVMHYHCHIEKLPDEILAAFKASDSQHKGTIHSKHLKNLLHGWGEKLNSKEIEQIFREASVNSNSKVTYDEFVKIACAPIPDYY
ncbi:calmodulin-like protein 4 [Daktulosphaira vitifoliae]|uniref:calmodulin-like protein 4 n=1 Tax=Daktulosphaira vitifoliae TaxID=58002 RepID=UPI0021A9A022|nr:calmodulin-like protein 4 [Daktulosphaira vitifoliae]